MASRTILSILLAVTCGCAGASANRKELKEAVEDFTREVRWGNWEVAAAYLLTPKPAEMEAQDTSGDIRVTDVALGAVVPQDEDHAQLTLVVEWYRLSRGTVRRTVLRQTWQRKGGGWRIRSQKRLRGPLFPLLPDVSAPKSGS